MRQIRRITNTSDLKVDGIDASHILDNVQQINVAMFIHIEKILVIGTLVTSVVALQAPRSRVPTIPHQIVIVTSTPRCRHTKKDDFAPITKYDIIKYADVTGVITLVVDTCRCVLC